MVDEAVALTIAAECLIETQVKERSTEERRLRDLVTAVLGREPPRRRPTRSSSSASSRSSPAR